MEVKVGDNVEEGVIITFGNLRSFRVTILKHFITSLHFFWYTWSKWLSLEETLFPCVEMNFKQREELWSGSAVLQEYIFRTAYTALNN